MSLSLILNGQARVFEKLSATSTLEQLVTELGLKGDRVAVEHNGEISARAAWAQVALDEGDRVEIVHFVGGGSVRSR